MAPRLAGPRRSQPQGEHAFREFGKVGRKTGITLKETAARDEHGMERLDEVFSSPQKSPEHSDYDSGEDMDMETTSGLDPTAVLNGSAKRLSVPLATARVRSPVKVGATLKSPARRLGSSPARELSAGEKEMRLPAQSVKRRLDFRAAQRVLHGAGRLQNGNGDEEAHDEDEVEEVVLLGRRMEHGNGDESLAMLSVVGDQKDGFIARTDEGGGGEENDADENAVAGSLEPLQKKRARKPKTAPEPERETEFVGEMDISDPAPTADEDESLVVKEKRIRPAKNKLAQQSAKKAPQKSWKRRSLPQSEDEEETEQEAEAGPQPKRRRTAAGKQRDRPVKSEKRLIAVEGDATSQQHEAVGQEFKAGPANEARTAAGKGRKPDRAPSRGQKAAATGARDAVDADTTLPPVPRGPPLPKSRGLLISRLGTGGGPGILQTRSGRNSFRPIAFWRNERVDYFDEAGEVEDALPNGRGTKRSKMVLPTVKEVVRVEEPEPRKRPSHRRAGARINNKIRGRPARDSDDDDDDDDPADAWEVESGHLVGRVTKWHPSYENRPPPPNEEVELEETRIAVSVDGIQTRPVKNARFAFTKTVVEEFYSAGLIDLPPGAVKSTKNSRKMLMTFFVARGRLRVTVDQNNFRIRKGGMFVVPRGNYYSIENDYDKPARVFFSQGCETGAQMVEGPAG